MDAPDEPAAHSFALNLSNLALSIETQPEPDSERMARLVGHPEEVTEDDLAWLSCDSDRNADFVGRMKAKREAEAREARPAREAARRAREADAQTARRAAATRAEAEQATRRALIDRTPLLDLLTLAVVDLDPRVHRGRRARADLIRAVETGWWGSVGILCPLCRKPGGSVQQSDRDGSLLARCGGGSPDADGNATECAHPEEVARAIAGDLADRREEWGEEDDDLPEMVNLADLLAEGDGEEATSLFLIDRLWPKAGRVLFGGPAKAGKTTGVDNLLRSLADGVPFLGAFEVEEHVERAVVIDLELTRAMARDWFDRLGFRNTQRVDVIPMRGLARTLDLRDPVLRSQWVRRLAGADVVVLDCLNPILDALDLPVTRVTQFLNLLDEVLIEAGVPNAVVVHHHNDNEQIGGGNKVRGWSDALWNVTMLDANDPSSARYFSAVVRGGGVDEGRLDFEQATGVLTYTEGTRAEAKVSARESRERERLSQASGVRRDAKAEDHLVMVRTLAADAATRWTAGEIGSLMADTDLSLQRVTHARKRCVKDGLLMEESAPGNSKVYTLTDKALAESAGAE